MLMLDPKRSEGNYVVPVAVAVWDYSPPASGSDAGIVCTLVPILPGMRDSFQMKAGP